MDDEDQPTAEHIEYADQGDEDQGDGQAAHSNANPANAVVGQGLDGQNSGLPHSLTEAQLAAMPDWNIFDWALHAVAQEEMNMNHDGVGPPRSILSPQPNTEVVTQRDGLQTYLIRQQLCAGLTFEELEPMDGPASDQRFMLGGAGPSGVAVQPPAMIALDDDDVEIGDIPPAEFTGTMRPFGYHPWWRFPPIRDPFEEDGTIGFNGESSVLPNAPTTNAFTDPNALHLPSIAPTEQEIEDAINGLNLMQPQQLSQLPPGANGLQHNQTMLTLDCINHFENKFFHYNQTMNTINGLNLMQPQQLAQFPPGANGLQYNGAMDTINGLNLMQLQQLTQYPPGANGLQSSVLPGNQTMNAINGTNGPQTQQWPQFTPGANMTSGPQPNTNQPTFGNSIADTAQGFTWANNVNDQTIDPALLSNPFSLPSSSLLPNDTQHAGSTNNANANAPQCDHFAHPHAHPPNVHHDMDFDPAGGWAYTPYPLRTYPPLPFAPSPSPPMQPMNDPTQANQIGFIPHANDAYDALPGADVNMANADDEAQQFMPTNNQTADDFSGITYPNPPVMPGNNQFGAVEYPSPPSYGSQQVIPNPLAGPSQYWGTNHGSQQQILNPLGAQYPFTTPAGPDQMMPGILTEVQFRDTTDSGSQQASSGESVSDETPSHSSSEEDDSEDEL